MEKLAGLGLEIFKELFPNELASRIMSDAHEMILVFNDESRVVFANNAFANFFGMDSAMEAVGMRHGYAVGCELTKDDGKSCSIEEGCVHCTTNKAISSALGGHFDEGEFSFIRKSDGKGCIYTYKAYPFEFRKARYAVLVLQDIGDATRRIMFENIFFHDVLNTATIVLNFAGLIRENASDSIKQFSERNYLAVRRLISEIQDQKVLLDAETGSLQLNLEKVYTSEILDTLLMDYHNNPLAEERGVSISGDCNLAFQCDRTLLIRVLGNAVKNALEASDRGHGVTLSALREGEAVDFKVHNDSVMGENVRNQLFNRAFSTKGRGRGLGAYSMKLITAQYLGGKISFTSTPEAGTTFTISIPKEPV